MRKIAFVLFSVFIFSLFAVFVSALPLPADECGCGYWESDGDYIHDDCAHEGTNYFCGRAECTRCIYYYYPDSPPDCYSPTETTGQFCLLCSGLGGYCNALNGADYCCAGACAGGKCSCYNNKCVPYCALENEVCTKDSDCCLIGQRGLYYDLTCNLNTKKCEKLECCPAGQPASFCNGGCCPGTTVCAADGYCVADANYCTANVNAAGNCNSDLTNCGGTYKHICNTGSCTWSGYDCTGGTNCNDYSACTTDSCSAGKCVNTNICAGTDTNCGCKTCTSCNALDNNNLGTHYCIGDSVYTTNRDYYCEGVGCYYTDSPLLFQTCNDLDNWYDSGTYYWDDYTDCKEIQRKTQVYKDYSCSSGECVPAPINERTVDTLNFRNKADGTSCNDNLYCTLSDSCVSGVCTGTARDCSSYSTAAISSCTNNPDNNPKTLDTRAAFTSTCNEITDSCTTAPSVTSICSASCGAACSGIECTSDCSASTDCCTQGELALSCSLGCCAGYNNVAGTCTESCASNGQSIALYGSCCSGTSDCGDAAIGFG